MFGKPVGKKRFPHVSDRPPPPASILAIGTPSGKSLSRARTPQGRQVSGQLEVEIGDNKTLRDQLRALTAGMEMRYALAAEQRVRRALLCSKCVLYSSSIQSNVHNVRLETAEPRESGCTQPWQ